MHTNNMRESPCSDSSRLQQNKITPLIWQLVEKRAVATATCATHGRVMSETRAGEWSRPNLFPGRSFKKLTWYLPSLRSVNIDELGMSAEIITLEPCWL